MTRFGSFNNFQQGRVRESSESVEDDVARSFYDIGASQIRFELDPIGFRFRFVAAYDARETGSRLKRRYADRTLLYLANNTSTTATTKLSFETDLGHRQRDTLRHVIFCRLLLFFDNQLTSAYSSGGSDLRLRKISTYDLKDLRPAYD